MSDIGFQMTKDRMSEGGYHGLDVYKDAHSLGVRIHTMTLKLPKFELYEEGSQIRRAAKRISSSIVEGYAHRKYKAQFLLYLYRALGSTDETQEHLRYLIETGSLADKAGGQALLTSACDLSRKLVGFIKGIEREHESWPLLRPVSMEDEELDSLVSTSDIPTSDIDSSHSKD